MLKIDLAVGPFVLLIAWYLQEFWMGELAGFGFQKNKKNGIVQVRVLCCAWKSVILIGFNLI